MSIGIKYIFKINTNIEVLVNDRQRNNTEMEIRLK